MSTSAQISAFKEAKKNFISNEERILNMIRSLVEFGATKIELEHALSMKHQTVTARLSSLRDQGKIYLKETDKLKDGCSTWYATPDHLINEYIKRLKQEKFLKWVDSGKKRFDVSDETAGIIALEYNENNFN